MTDDRKAASNAEVESAAGVGDALVDEIASLIAEHARRKYVFPEDIELAEKIAARRAPQAPQGDWVVALRADGSRVSLAECPIGLFLAESGELCLKTEYGNNEGRIDAYIVSSGEMFWGHAPQTIASQQAELVQPVALAPKEGAPAADLGRAVGAWAEIAEHYRCAMLAAETAINSTPMPVSDGQTSLIWKRFSEAATGLHTARMDMIHKYGPAFLNSGPIGPAALPAQAAPVAVKALLTRALSLIDAMFTNDPNEPVSDAGHTALDLWRHEADALRSALSGAAPQAGEDAR